MERQAAAKPQKNPTRVNQFQTKSARSSTGADTLLDLQRSIGSHAVERLIHSSYIQTKLNISQPGDAFEQEADQIADTVMRMPEPEAKEEVGERIQAESLASQITRLVQRQADQPSEEEQEETIATKLATDAPLQRQASKEEEKEEETLQTAPPIQRQTEEEDEEVQTKSLSSQLSHSLRIQRLPESASPAIQRLCTECEEEKHQDEGQPVQLKAGPASTPKVTAPLAVDVHALTGGGSPLPHTTRAFFEPRFGVDFSQVRVHTGTRADETARSVNAKAFTLGQHIVFRAAQYAPESMDGKRVLAHELVHTVQQKGNTAATGQTSVLWRIREQEWTPQERREIEAARKKAKEEKARKHAAWQEKIKELYPSELKGQSMTVGEERFKNKAGIQGQRIAMLNAAGAGSALEASVQELGRRFSEAMHAFYKAVGLGSSPEGVSLAHSSEGYSATRVRDTWVAANLAVTALDAALKTDSVGAETQVNAEVALTGFYEAFLPFAQTLEKISASVKVKNEEMLAEWNSIKSQIKTAVLSTALGGPAVAIISRMPTLLPVLKENISQGIEPAINRVQAASDVAAWKQVAADFAQATNKLDQGLIFLLPPSSEARQGFEYFQSLDTHLATMEEEHPLAFRIPAVFYPLDKFVNEDGKTTQAPEAIPWQFYLYHTGVGGKDPRDPIKTEGEWVLVDMTSPKKLKTNRAGKGESDLDAVRLREGNKIDPPIEMFEELNTKLRFPKGLLTYKMPSDKDQTLEIDHPFTWGDFFEAVAMTLTVIALVAGVIATGGAAAPLVGAIALGSGLGAVAAGVGATIYNLHELSKHGMLTSGDIFKAVVNFGLDLISMVSLGLGRLVFRGVKAGLAGTKSFMLLTRASEVAKAADIGGQVVQVATVSAEFIDAYNAIKNQPGLTDEERKKAMGELRKSALLTGAMMTAPMVLPPAAKLVMSEKPTFVVTNVDPQGRLNVHPEPTARDTPEPRPDVPEPAAGRGATPHAAPHAEVHAPVEAHAAEAGGGLTIAGKTHAVGVGGRGPTRGFYFCSDFCGELVDKLGAIWKSLPDNYPGRNEIFKLRRRVAAAARRLRKGEITNEQADTLSNSFATEAERLAAGDPNLATLVNMDTATIAARSGEIHGELTRGLDVAETVLEDFGTRQTQGRSQSRDPMGKNPPRSGLENDVLDVFGFGPRNKPGGPLQPEHFDVGNFGHTHAEALVKGLPPNLNKEVLITLSDGTVRRADRVQFTHDVEGNVLGGVVYEIKPNTKEWKRKGAIQAENYARYLEEVHNRPRGSFGHICLTYNRAAVRRLVRQLRK